MSCPAMEPIPYLEQLTYNSNWSTRLNSHGVTIIIINPPTLTGYLQLHIDWTNIQASLTCDAPKKTCLHLLDDNYRKYLLQTSHCTLCIVQTQTLIMLNCSSATQTVSAAHKQLKLKSLNILYTIKYCISYN